jgi:uncharacterized protein YecT (DUF1311 family)
MHFMKRMFVGIFVAALSCPACAVGPASSLAPLYVSWSEALDRQIAACDHAQDLSAMNACRIEAMETAREQMEAAVQTLSESYKDDEPDLLPLFEAAQGAWRSQVDRECAFETYYSHDTEAYDAEHALCMERKYLGRTSYLHYLLENP